MSHQVRLTLRPPPNVDFVHGYPGIPPGADRPQAAVKGAIEIRVPPQGVRAKWVRIELRKVETLPGGGPTNTFHDYVGPTPLNLWNAPEGDYGMLRTGDFQFSIRIPESIPPSIALENRAGINYELVASVCVKGKKGFFRRSKSSVVSTTSQIIIDKHELHSTWPIYTQPESRTLAHEGVTLLVERRNTCYGPGDRITLWATIKSDALHTIILRGFELILKESSVYRAGAFAQGKKAVPQAKVQTVSEAKFAVNATIYGGMGHKAELSCGLSPDHTTTTLNAARHIDVTYTVVVRALMGTGVPVVMELPVIISNWQRHVSVEAVRRIGPAPALSLLPHQNHQGHTHNQQSSITRVEPLPRANVSATMPTRQQSPLDARSATVGAPTNNNNNNMKADEFGYGAGYGGSLAHVKTHQSTGSRSSNEDRVVTIGTPAKEGGGRRPTSSRSIPQQRFTITNLGGEILEDERPSGSQPPPPAQGGGGGGGQGRWPTAEEEKLKLYESARVRAERMQGGVAPPPARPISPPTPAPAPASPSIQAPQPQPATPNKTPGNWPTAEEEKIRLFQSAQAAVQRTQQASPPSSLHSLGTPPQQQAQAGGSKAAALYSAAMASRNVNAGNLPSTPPQQQQQAKPKPKIPQYPSAEQEKAALRRYEEAKRAVDRTQGGEEDANAGLVAYDSLYPGQQQGGGDLPPPFEPSASASGIPAAHLSEKERMRREYEARDAMLARSDSAISQQQQQQGYPGGYVNPNYASPPPPQQDPPAFSANAQYANAIAEKEALRRKFEAQDAAAATAPQPPPPRVASPQRGARPALPRPTPQPPVAGAQVLTAAEEKALLRARYESEDNTRKTPPPKMQVYTNGYTPRAGSSTAPPSPTGPLPPPPLMPRPPVEYIQETQEVDARISRYANSAESPPLDEPQMLLSSQGLGRGGLPEIRPFTPFNPAFEGIKLPGLPPPPPPLPPKPAGE